jgi:leucyl aminopeptidase
MKLQVRDSGELDAVCDALILPTFEDVGIKAYGTVDRALDGVLKDIVRSGEFAGSKSETCLVHTQGRIKPKRLLLVGLGKKTEAQAEDVRRAGGVAASALAASRVKDAALSTLSLKGKLSPVDFAEGATLSQYSFTLYKKDNGKKLKSFVVLSGEKGLLQGIKRIEGIAAAVHYARDLVNTPAKDMTPSVLAREARKLKGVTVKVLERKGCEMLRMGSYLSVARGSMEPPKFIVATYTGRKDRSAPLVLVGKSVTFDSGGLSLKPSKSMETMKYDMAGGAVVLGVLRAASELKTKANIIAVLPATENLPGQSPSKPGDVVRAMIGKTIEVLNTDAEGRLALADAIGYARIKLKPRAVVNIATLTGACSVALGSEAAALMGNDESLMRAVEQASSSTGERVWRMPLYDDYKEYPKSEIADLANVSSKGGGLVTAGYFLKEFAGDTPWAHLDIAGTGWADSAGSYTLKGATGFGVRLLLSLIENF